jgi:hypothetical protein
MNGNKGDDPILDIVYWKTPRFSPEIDSLIAEIVQLGGRADIERSFNLSQPPALQEFEAALRTLRDTLKKDRKDRGWEI